MSARREGDFVPVDIVNGIGFSEGMLVLMAGRVKQSGRPEVCFLSRFSYMMSAESERRYEPPNS